MVKLPVLEMVTALLLNTPAVKLAVVPLPADKVPVEVISTVPVKLVTVLLLASCAVIVAILNDVPAVCVPIEEIAKWCRVPGFTVKLLLVPVSVLPVLVAVMVKLPVLEMVTALLLNTPAVKLAVVPLPDDKVPVDVISTVPVKLVTVLLLASWAVIVAILNALPAACVLMLEIAKGCGSPGFTLNVLLPVLLEPVTTKVTPVPATVGVTLTLLNTPAVNAADVPVMPAVPL